MGKANVRQSYRSEATAICSYLLNTDCPKRAVELYERIIQEHESGSDDRDWLMFALRHKWSIGLLDAGLAFTDPHNELRRRIYIMFAILESIPELSDKFLPRRRSPFYILVMAGVGVRAVFRATTGVILLKLVKRA